jgi:Flp pilus assembly protein TadD
MNLTVGTSTFLSLVLWFTFLPSPQGSGGLSSGPGHTLRGKVYTAAGMPVSQPVRVRLINQGLTVGETFTDASGSFTFSRVRNGNYEVIADGDGRVHETTTVEIEIFFSSGNAMSQMVTCNVTLKAINGTTPSAKPVTREVDASVPKDARKEYEKGVKSAKNGKSTNAVESFENALKLYPKYYDALFALGQEQTKLRKYPEARSAFQQATEIKPKEGEAHLNLGVVMVKSGAYNDAIPVLRHSLELGERGMASYLFLGVALMETSSNEEAEKMLLKALDIGGHLQPGLRLYLANLYNRIGNQDKTLEQLEAYVREAPTASNVEEIKKLILHIKDQKKNN